MNEIINKLITNYINETYGISIKSIELEHPQKIENGHLSTNVALKNCKEVGMNPRELASELVLLFTDNEYINECSVAGPGFINFYFNDNYFDEIITYADSDQLVDQSTADGEKYNLEYVSANPTGDLHLGHARNGVYSDALARVMKKAGYDVTREYYINDAGVQMGNLGLSVQYFYFELLKKEIEFPEGGYRGKDIKKIAQDLFNDHGDELVDKPVEFFTEHGYAINLSEIKKVMGELNIEFDIYTSERFYHENGLVGKCLDVLRKNNEIYEKDGAIWLESSKYNDDKDRVIQKSDGTYTYLTSDIAYHLDKFNRGYTRLIDVWGGDHHGYVNRIKASVESLGQNPEHFEIILIQMVSLFMNNKQVKMSKRLGTSITIKELIDEIGVEAIRYFFVNKSVDTQLDFDIELAKQNNSDNPIFYIQYANARICSLIEKAALEGITDYNQTSNFNLLEKELVLHMSKYSKVVCGAAKSRQPHVVANYVYELATLFHRFYNSEKIISEDLVKTKHKLAICKATQNILSDALSVLGIAPRAKM